MAGVGAEVGANAAFNSLDNLAIGSLDELTNAAINPVLARSTLHGQGFIKSGVGDDFTVATASVRSEDGVQYFVSISGNFRGGANGSGITGDTVKIGDNIFNVVRSNTGSVSPTVKLNGESTVRHAEAKLFSEITSKYNGKRASVVLAVQNNSISKPGFCSGCAITVENFATRNPGFNINAFTGSTRVTP